MFFNFYDPSINVLKVSLPISSYYFPHFIYIFIYIYSSPNKPDISWIHLLFVHLFVSIIMSCKRNYFHLFFIFFSCRICNFHEQCHLQDHFESNYLYLLMVSTFNLGTVFPPKCIRPIQNLLPYIFLTML